MAAILSLGRWVKSINRCEQHAAPWCLVWAYDGIYLSFLKFSLIIDAFEFVPAEPEDIFKMDKEILRNFTAIQC